MTGRSTKSLAARGARERAGYFGMAGSFSHEVAWRAFPDAALEPFEVQAEGFDRLRAGALERIVVPFENSIGGAVPETLDQLLLLKHWEREFRIQRQLVYPVNLCLLGRGRMDGVRRVCSHFVPFQVVGGWLGRHLPKAERVVLGSTSAAAMAAAKDPRTAAIANAGAARVYGLRILASGLAAPSGNQTRFLVVGLHRPGEGGEGGGVRRGMVHLRLRNRAGALADVLVALKRRRLNLTQILSRPVRGSPGEYQFLLEMDLPKGACGVEAMGDFLGRLTTLFHPLGEYPVTTLKAGG